MNHEPLPDHLKSIDKQVPLILMACCIWGEARGESQAAKVAVGCVIRNRVGLQPRYGTGFTGVILRPYQFSCFNATDPNRLMLLDPLGYGTPATWNACYDVAASVYFGEAKDPTEGATHYFDASIVAPSWSLEMTATVVIGKLSFFRED